MFIFQETPTGAINGSNKVFTLALPPYQIAAIVLDGADYLIGPGYGSYSFAVDTITLGDAPSVSLQISYFTANPVIPGNIGTTDLATYLQLLTQKLAQSNTGFHTTEDRVESINEAILSIADKYEIPQLRRKPYPNGTITFTNGVADFPLDMLRVVKLWNPTPTPVEYTYLVNDLFDDQPPNSVNTVWTIDYDVSTGTQRMFIAPSVVSPTVLNMRYIANPTILVNSNDQSGIDFHWDYAVAYKAASILLNNERNPSAPIMEEEANMEIKKAYEAVRKSGGVKQGERLRSRFEKYPLLNAPQV